MDENPGLHPHSCTLENRSGVKLTGVREMISFDENQVVMDTDLGLLTIKGKELHVSRLSVEQGEVAIEGTVDNLAYSSNEAYRRAGQSFLARLFG
ncbi:MAG TPA: sporulation protein YabP [Candidatus Ventrimonas merdavium]|nr:sporulation protein YabP [Candidatus Ventrimonas merdavium]